MWTARRWRRQTSRSMRQRRMLRLVWRRHRRAVHTYLELSRLDEKLLYDIGIDPLDMSEALRRRRSPSILLEPMRRQFQADRKTGL